MRFLIAGDFLTEFEYIECESKQVAERYILSKGENTEGITILGCSDGMFLSDIPEGTPVIYLNDYESEEE